MHDFKMHVLILCGFMMLTGCSSFGYGIAEAIMDHNNQQNDTRICAVTGRPFSGLEPLLKDGLKVLMVHGIGDHTSGYSAEFLNKLTAEMGLNKKSPGYKTIDIFAPIDATKNLGLIRVHHYFNKDHSKTLLFYELVWSSITQEAKKVIAYDSTGEYAHRRESRCPSLHFQINRLYFLIRTNPAVLQQKRLNPVKKYVTKGLYK